MLFGERANRRGAGPSCGGAKSAEERLWDTPDELRMKKTEGEETADRWLTGIVEVQLPADYKIKNIEACLLYTSPSPRDDT